MMKAILWNPCVGKPGIDSVDLALEACEGGVDGAELGVDLAEEACVGVEGVIDGGDLTVDSIDLALQ